MPLVGPMLEDSFSRRCNLIRVTRLQLRLGGTDNELVAVDAEARRKALSIGARHVRRYERA